jgi:hypothetical protein
MRGWDATETCRTVVPDREHPTRKIRFAIASEGILDRRPMREHVGESYLLVAFRLLSGRGEGHG